MAIDSALLVRKIPYATEQLTVSNAVKQLTSALVANTAQAEGNTNYWKTTRPAAAVVIECADANGVCYTVDGSTPSSTNGLRLVAANQSVTITDKQKIANLKMIRLAGSDAVVNVAYFKE